MLYLELKLASLKQGGSRYRERRRGEGVAAAAPRQQERRVLDISITFSRLRLMPSTWERDNSTTHPMRVMELPLKWEPDHLGSPQRQAPHHTRDTGLVDNSSTDRVVKPQPTINLREKTTYLMMTMEQSSRQEKLSDPSHQPSEIHLHLDPLHTL